MPPVLADHRKSLLPYKAVLEGSEQEYRDATSDERDEVIAEIMLKLADAADRKALIAEGDKLEKVRVYSVPR